MEDEGWSGYTAKGEGKMEKSTFILHPWLPWRTRKDEVGKTNDEGKLSPLPIPLSGTLPNRRLSRRSRHPRQPLSECPRPPSLPHPGEPLRLVQLNERGQRRGGVGAGVAELGQGLFHRHGRTDLDAEG